MIKDSDIKEFYQHVEGLGLKFPVAAISKATGYNKGNVSQYLSGKQEPSESFLEAYYKAFPKSIEKVSRENKNEGERVMQATIDVLFDVAVELLSATSGENVTLVRKKLEKRVDELRRFSAD